MERFRVKLLEGNFWRFYLRGIGDAGSSGVFLQITNDSIMIMMKFVADNDFHDDDDDNDDDDDDDDFGKWYVISKPWEKVLLKCSTLVPKKGLLGFLRIAPKRFKLRKIFTKTPSK